MFGTDFRNPPAAIFWTYRESNPDLTHAKGA